MFVIAEAGVNHNGSIDLAHRLVDAAAELGADAVKFQTFVPELLAAVSAPTADYQHRATGTTDQRAMLADLALETTAWGELKAHADEVGIEFMSTPFDRPSLDLLLELGVKRLKVPSGELTNLAFIRDIASHDLPVILSTGMGDLDDVIRAVDAAAGCPHLTILHCVSAYPAPLADANLAAMATLRQATGVDIGWSDHCAGTLAVTLAVALGATVIERHLTLDRALVGPDHGASDDPRAFGEYLRAIRTATVAMGDGVKARRPSEVEVASAARRSWHTARDLAAGDRIGQADLVALRPATGISTALDIVGQTVVASLGAGQAIRPRDLTDFDDHRAVDDERSVGERLRRIAIFTGTRADLGLLAPVVEAMVGDSRVEPLLIVAGTHTDPGFGFTAQEIRQRGLRIGRVLDLPVYRDDRSIAELMAATVRTSAQALSDLQVDLAMVLGDRYEALAFASACVAQRTPLAHFHGGEVTEGAVDDSMRNAITQLADLHLVAAEPFAERVVEMGAAPESVHVVGAPGLDAVTATLRGLDDPRSAVERLVGPLPGPGPVYLLAYHPETRSQQDQGVVVDTIFEALLEDEHSTILTSAPNADWDRSGVAEAIAARVARHPERVRFAASFGHRGFTAAMAHCDVMVGNSSAGIIEAPLIGTPSVTVGRRQRGRPLADSVFEARTDRDSIRTALSAARAHGRSPAGRPTIYGDGRAAGRVREVVHEFLASRAAR